MKIEVSIVRRGRSKNVREVTNFQQAPYGQKKNPFQPMSIFSEDEIESIHQASLKVLCDTGMDIQSPRAVEILKREGAMIGSDGRRVRFDPDFVMEKISTTPSEFTLHGRHKGQTRSCWWSIRHQYSWSRVLPMSPIWIEDES